MQHATAAVEHPKSNRLLNWRERWLQLRDQLLANQRFQRWAADFPLTRRIAKQRARALFDLCAGFVYSQVLLACVRLRLFEMLRDGPLTVAELATRMGLPLTAAHRLLDAAIAIKLLERRSAQRIGLGPHGAALLGNPAVLAMIEHHHVLYADLQDPVALLRGQQADTQLSRYWAYARASDPAALSAEQVATYSTLMSASQPLVAEDILDAYPVTGHQRLLDVGGGEGKFLIAAAARAPDLQCVLFDLPGVVSRAVSRFAAAGIAERARAIGGSFLSDALPAGADLISLVRVVHDHDDPAVLTLLRACHLALAPNGTLLIAEPLAGTEGAEAMGDAYFGFYLLAMGSGRPRTLMALTALLQQAGFDQVREVPTRHPLQTRVLLARRGGKC